MTMLIDIPEKKPFRKYRRDDDECEDDAPARRKEKAANRSSMPLWIPVSGLLGLVGVIVLIIVLASNGKKENEERKEIAETKLPTAKESNRKKTSPKEPEDNPQEDAGQKVFNQGVKSTAFIYRPIDDRRATPSVPAR